MILEIWQTLKQSQKIKVLQLLSTKKKKVNKDQGQLTLDFLKAALKLICKLQKYYRFVMKLSENNYICAGYSLGKLIQEKSFKNPA